MACYSHEQWLVRKKESRSVTGTRSGLSGRLKIEKVVTRTIGLSEWLVTHTSGLSGRLNVEVSLARVAQAGCGT